ncbi:hypothetical protein [Aquimarina algiphila]|uniref:hypothetical protein n=1 Tax=Aquimarina algiphila TaxID=2047982 RepID=UPI00232B2D1E|nr:hypothetical protein [Aquimarina algiphila]
MYNLKKNVEHNDDDVEDLFNLLEKNLNCTQTLIHHIDAFIERKHPNENMLNVLTTVRNTCAVNAMNITRLTRSF